MDTLSTRRSIKIHVLGTVIALRGLAYGITFAAAIGVAVAALHGDRVLDMVERFAGWIETVRTDFRNSGHEGEGEAKEKAQVLALQPVPSAPRADHYRASP